MLVPFRRGSVYRAKGYIVAIDRRHAHLFLVLLLAALFPEILYMQTSDNKLDGFRSNPGSKHEHGARYTHDYPASTAS